MIKLSRSGTTFISKRYDALFTDIEGWFKIIDSKQKIHEGFESSRMLNTFLKAIHFVSIQKMHF